MWQGRREFGDRETESDVHDGDDCRRDEQAAEATRKQTEIPAEKSPEMTAPTPSAQSDQTPANRRSPRASK